MSAERNDHDADRLVRIARTNSHLGRVEHAVARYDEALAARPGFGDAFLEVVDVLTAAHDWAGVAARCERWIEHFPDHASHGLSDRVHNLRIDALCRVGGIDLACDAYDLEPITPDRQPADDAILAIIVARNERPRLEFLLEHHRRLGVDGFVFVDNGSDDGSVEYLVSQPDTVVWRTTGSYLHANAGVAWTDLILRRYSPQQWCLVFDADELFVFPRYERRGLRSLCADLDQVGATCYQAIELDMYGPGRLSESEYRQGDDPVDEFPYFDRVYYRLRIPFDGPRRNMTNLWGGVRSRVFGGDFGGYLLNKVPLFRYTPGEVLMSGQHWLSRPTAEIAPGRGALLHFKYTAHFAAAVAEEVARKEHARRAAVYEQYARGLDRDPDPVLFDPAHSVRFRGSEQLVALGVMRDGHEHARVTVTRESVAVPDVPPVAESSDRPFWSVVMVASATSDDGERIAHVMDALAGAARSELVIVTSPDESTAVANVDFEAGGSHALTIVSTPYHLTEVEAVNVGLGHTRGRWVHVIGLDSAAHCLYEKVGAAIDAPGVALALQAPAPLARGIDLDFDARSSTFIAARQLYERVGGFCASVPLAAPWEMFQRLAHAAGAPVWVSTPAANAPATDPRRAGPGYGEEVVQRLAAIDVAADVLDLTAAEVAELRDRCATQAADRVRDDVEHGRFASALATVGEALRVPVSDGARERLTATLGRTVG